MDRENGLTEAGEWIIKQSIRLGMTRKKVDHFMGKIFNIGCFVVLIMFVLVLLLGLWLVGKDTLTAIRTKDWALLMEALAPLLYAVFLLVVFVLFHRIENVYKNWRSKLPRS